MHHHRFSADCSEEDHVRREGSFEVIIDHGVSTVFDHDDFVAKMLQPWQCLNKHVCPDFWGERRHELFLLGVGHVLGS